MQLLREWRRRAFGAAIGAVVAPAAILAAALAVGFGGGGLDALGALGQAFEGPRLPDSAPLTRPRDARDTARLLAQVRAAAAAAAPTAADGTAAGTGPAGPATDGTTDGGQTPTGTGFDPADTNTPPGTDPVATQPPPVSTPAPTTPPPVATESPVRQVGDTVRGVTDQLPIVGAPTGEIVDGVVDTVDTILQP